MSDSTTTQQSPFDDAGDVVTTVTGQEHRLLAELATGAALSAVAGSATWLLGRRHGRVGVAAFGRQSLAWAIVDAAIAAAWGRRGAARPPLDADEALTKARRLRKVTLINAGLDVGYVAGGAALAARGRTAGRRGDGFAIVVQGLFLLWLDGRHARRFHAVTRRFSR